MKCSACGTEIPPGQEYHIRREWKKKGFAFCEDCVTSGRAWKWAESQEEEEH